MDKGEKHRKICEELGTIYSAKNADYGDSFGETFERLGIISAVTRITDKTNRLQTLATQAAKVEDEKIEDTLMDLANYAIMTLIELNHDERQNYIDSLIDKAILNLQQGNDSFALASKDIPGFLEGFLGEIQGVDDESKNKQSELYASPTSTDITGDKE